ncbi:MAG: hypothetical protein IPO81_15000 [Kouleothrix sp.]|nr:hypothetical protein [Kouleothrix sp.]
MVDPPDLARRPRLYRVCRGVAISTVAACLLGDLALRMPAALLWHALPSAAPSTAALLIGAIALAGGWLARSAWRAQPQGAAIDAQWWMALFPALGPAAGGLGADVDGQDAD